MNDNTLLNLEIITPSEIVLSLPVTMVVVPGVEGDMGILPGHIALISLLRPGVVSIYNGNIISKNIFVSGGYVEISKEGCKILADDAIATEQINKADLHNQIEQLKTSLATLSEQETISLKQQLTILQSMLEAANK